MEIRPACLVYLYCGAAFLMSMLQLGEAKRNQIIYCGACLALVEEMNWQIATVDPKKKIQVGSFRLDTNGNQGTHEVPLARSDVQIHEYLDNVCGEMQHYAESVDEKGNVNFIRTAARDGQRISLKNVEVKREKHDSLIYACGTILEEHEDELFDMLQKSTGMEENEQELSMRLCVDVVGVCTAEDVKATAEQTKWSLSEGLREQQEEEERKAREEEERIRKEQEREEEGEDEGAEEGQEEEAEGKEEESPEGFEEGAGQPEGMDAGEDGSQTADDGVTPSPPGEESKEEL